jgi:hypothetical protein
MNCMGLSFLDFIRLKGSVLPHSALVAQTEVTSNLLTGNDQSDFWLSGGELVERESPLQPGPLQCVAE